jgi:hypothetical protein
VVESEFLPDAGGRGVMGEVVVGFKTESAGDRGHNFTLKLGAPTGKRIVRTFREGDEGIGLPGERSTSQQSFNKDLGIKSGWSTVKSRARALNIINVNTEENKMST